MALADRASTDENTYAMLSLMYDDNLMVEAKAAIEANDPAIMPVFNELKEYTEANYLTMKPVSIVDGKLSTGPSGDPRDWVTLSQYWWEDPENPEGPYIRQDGNTNPKVNDFPEQGLGSKMSFATQALGFMYYITGDEKYASKSAELLRKFFLDPDQGMNPNLNFAQYVPRMDRIRGTGVDDGQRIMAIINGAKIISGSQAWTDEDEAQLKDWTRAFAYWLENSSQGIAESLSINNHGTSYEATLEMALLYVGDYEYLKEVIIKNQLPRIPRVLNEDSVSLSEVSRPKGLNYSTTMTYGIYKTAIMAQKVGLNDVWSYKGENGRSMVMNLDFLIQHWLEPSKWPFQQTSSFDSHRAAMILEHAGKQLGNQRYIDAAKKIGVKGRESYARIRFPEDVLYYKISM